MTIRDRTSIGAFVAICVALGAVVALGGCSGVSKDLGAAGKAPGIYVCAGQGAISASGQVAVMPGISGSIMFNCGQGAYFGQGYPSATLPVIPSGGSPNIGSFPPLGTPPTTSP